MPPIFSALPRPVHRLPMPAYAIGGPTAVSDAEFVSDRDRAVGYFGAGSPVAEIPHDVVTISGATPPAATSATNSVETLASKLEDAAARHEDEIDEDVAQFVAERLHDLAQTARERGISTVEGLRDYLDFRF